jgi:anti-sigma regulatory factor (Ser/Thr protein kinase)
MGGHAVDTTALSITENVNLSSIGALRRRAASAAADAGAGDELVSSIRLCVSEALANAMMHGYPDHSGIVEVAIELDEDWLVVTVRDEGQGLARRSEGVGEEGGLGLEIIRKLTDSVRLTSDLGQGTEIRMTFARGSDSPPVGITTL